MEYFYLEERALLAEGNKRFCFQHPDDSGKCIKVKKRKDGWEENLIEWFYLKSLSFKKKEVPCLVKCYGWVSTNMGYGVVFDKVVDEDGSDSLVLKSFIKEEYEELSCETVLEMAEELKKYCLKYSVAVTEPNEKNIMVRKDASGCKLVLIDGVGGREGLSIKNILYILFPFYARRKTKKQFLRFEKKIKIWFN
ncbi:hypothetical protein GPM19_13410 [Halomonas sp. ZH2S]|uniref:PhoP regulatory network protein YrbL n=1 Tax=Vreelandella zhuhanensis TaxID=2684210 RepID=A0A7X3H275_9GAMM|nr:YrbL family protein [Halomonas zhuhanensis]MWJ29177.1 hypothetical protein [Halomonas zhuhanensis]